MLDKQLEDAHISLSYMVLVSVQQSKKIAELESENAKLKEPKGCNACNHLMDNVCNHPGIPEFHTPQYINYSGCSLHAPKEE